VDVVQRDALQLLGIRGLRRRAENRDGGILWGRPRPKRGCRAIDGWTDGCTMVILDGNM
jgi:hypothetical protein